MIFKHILPQYDKKKNIPKADPDFGFIACLISIHYFGWFSAHYSIFYQKLGSFCQWNYWHTFNFKSPQRGIISLITHDLSQDYYLLNACSPILSNSIKLKSPYPHPDQTGRGYYRVLSTEKWNGPFCFCRERWKPIC